MRLLPRKLNASSANLPARLGQRRIRPTATISPRHFSCTVRNPYSAIFAVQKSSSTRNFASTLTYDHRSYSSETTQKPISPPSPTDTISLTDAKEDMDALLVMACNQARDISELVKIKQREKPQTPIRVPPTTPPKTITIVQPPKFESPKEASEQISKSWNIQHELQAAEALLKITSHPSFHTALASKRKEALQSGQERDVALSLHNGFLAVSHWLCSTLATCEPMPMHGLDQRDAGKFHQFGDATISQVPIAAPLKESVLLTNLFHLMERCHHLNLPLTIPIYQKILSLLARFSSSSEVAYMILDASTQVRDILSIEEETNCNILTASFFAPALKELLCRNRLRDMVEVLHGMKSIHGIGNVDLTTGMELLSLLNAHVEELVRGDGSSTGTLHGALLDEGDAMEVALLLQRPVMEELDSKKKELEEYQAQCGVTMGAILDQQSNEDCGDGSMENEDIDPEWDDDVESLKAAVESMATDNKERIEREAETMTNDLFKKSYEADPGKDHPTEHQSTGMTVRFHVNQSTGEVENVELIYIPKARNEARNKLKGWQRSLLRDMVYMRDAESWQLPDIVTQLEEWNSGRGILFSKVYETELMNEIAEEDDTFGLSLDEGDNDIL